MLAAGAVPRFGGTKQLADLDGRPLLQHAIDAANAETGLERVVVVLGHEAERIRAAVDLGRAEVVIAEGWDEGQAASLRTGVRAAGDAEAAVVLEHRLFGELLRLRGDMGARDVLAHHRVLEVEMDAEQTDVDTREQLEEMRR